MITIGPYTFSATDAQKTVASHPIVWELMSEGRDASVLRPLEPRLTGDITTDLPAVWAAWHAGADALRAAGQLPERTIGSVQRLHVSDGGLPKLPIDTADVTWKGMAGDRQASRNHHGRPWQALCLWSTEVIDEFRAAGHPLAPGLAGENITVTGLPWHLVRPGVDLRIGEVRCRVSSYAIPCKQNRDWFLDGRFDLMHHSNGPVSRVYATVLEPGRIEVGAAAVLEP